MKILYFRSIFWDVRIQIKSSQKSRSKDLTWISRMKIWWYQFLCLRKRSRSHNKHKWRLRNLESQELLLRNHLKNKLKSHLKKLTILKNDVNAIDYLPNNHDGVKRVLFPTWKSNIKSSKKKTNPFACKSTISISSNRSRSKRVAV